MTEFLFPIVVSDLCPLPSTAYPLTLISFFINKAVTTALPHNVIRIMG